MAASSVLNLLAFIGPEPNNLVKACICAAIGFAIGFIATWLFGFTKKEIEGATE